VGAHNSPRLPRLDLRGPTSKGKERSGKGGKGEGKGRGSTQPGLSFSLVYATPLLGQIVTY